VSTGGAGEAFWEAFWEAEERESQGKGATCAIADRAAVRLLDMLGLVLNKDLVYPVFPSSHA